MPSFRYTAILPTGELSRGTMDAADEQAVVRQLQRAGSLPVRTDPAKGGFLAELMTMELGANRSLRKQEVSDLTRELSIMLAAGQDLDRALRFLADTAPNKRVRATTERLRQSVRDGASLAAALSEHPASFPRLYIGLVRAAEAGSTLAATLERLATLLERERGLASTITSALIYPALLLVAAVGSIGLLLTEVLPQFVPLFQQNGVALPRPTRVLIATGDLATAYGLYAIAGLVVAGLAARQALRRPAARLIADRLLLRVPVVGALSREVMAARFTRTLGTLVLNGVPLIAALGIVRDTIGNLAGVAAVDAAAISAKGGAGLSRPLAQSGLFPIRMIYLLGLGEETAQLGPMALRAAEIHEEKTRIGVQRLVALLVPAITIVMGAAIAGIVASLLLAMLSLNDLAQ